MRKTITLLLIAIALAAYVYFYEIKGGEEREREKEAAEKLFNFEKDSVHSIEIKSYKGNFTFLKSEDGWQITVPVQIGADESPINSLLSSLSNTKKIRTFPIAVDALPQYGLKFRALSINFTLNDGVVHSVSLGDKTSIGSNIYASKKDTVVSIIPSTLKTNADKALFDWRDKKAIHINKDQVRSFTLKNRNGNFTFEKESGDWQITTPLNAKAEKSSVEAILTKMDWGKINSVAVESAANLSTYNLNKPQIRIDFFSGQEKARTGISFSALKDNSAHGKDDARPHVFRIDSAFLKPMQGSLYSFRDKKILSFDKDKADGLNLSYEGSLMIFAKDSSGTWRLSSGEKAKNFKINNVLSTLKNLEAAKFVEEKPRYFMPYGLVNPEGRIEIFAGDELLAELDVGFKKDGSVYIHNPRREPVVSIKESKLKDIFPDEADLLEEAKETEEAVN